jgi:hypothetical protein
MTICICTNYISCLNAVRVETEATNGSSLVSVPGRVFRVRTSRRSRFPFDPANTRVSFADIGRDNVILYSLVPQNRSHDER